MTFFGEPWPSGLCDSGRQVPTPVGKLCFDCDQAIMEGHRGDFTFANPDITMDKDHVVWVFTAGPFGSGEPRSYAMYPRHRECSLRAVLGGVGHHLDHDYWCTKMGDPDGGRSRRESSLLVWALNQSGELS